MFLLYSAGKGAFVFMFVYLLLVAAAIGFFQRSLEEIKADLVNRWLEKVFLHQTVPKEQRQSG